MKNKKLTLKDIADMAGVSLTTASMYLNGKAKQYNLADATCKRIENVIRENNFVPNFHARAIASKQTFLIGVQVCDSLDSSFFLKILAGIEKKLTEQQYHMVLSVSHFSAEKEQESIRFMCNKGIDGLIIMPVNEKKNNFTYLQELSKTMPVVTINKKIEGISASYNHNYNGGRLVGELLINKGHRKIAFIGGDHYDRECGFSDELKKKNITYETFSSVPLFLEKAKDFSAVFCFSDIYVLELYNMAASRGIKIPEDLSVIGYDNMDFLKSLLPQPITIEQGKKTMGIAAGEIILSQLKGEKNVPDRVFNPVLCKGESVNTITDSDQKAQ